MYADCWPLMPLYHGNNAQGVGRYEAEECGLFTTSSPRNEDVIRYQRAYVAKIATELNAFDNVIYDLCDEPSLQGKPDGSVLTLPDRDVAPWLHALAAAFLEAEAALPKKHVLGQTVQSLSRRWRGDDQPQRRVRFDGVAGVPGGAVASALAEPGRQYAVYLFRGGDDGKWGAHFVATPGSYRDTLTLKAVPAGTYRLEWVDPVSGVLTASEAVRWEGGDLAVTTPPYRLDVALRMRALP